MKPRACLLLEDEQGGPVEVTARELDAQLREHRPRLLFLSACETAAAAELLDSLATDMLRYGLPAVLVI